MMRATSLKAKEKSLPEASYQTITPDQAQQWLDDAAPNRNLILRRIDQYAEIMKRGDWLLTNQGIAFDERGKLIDGQHRLSALVKADVPVVMLVVNVIKTIAQLVMDQGSVRRAHEQIKLREGFDIQAIHVAVAKSMIVSVGGPGDRVRSKMITDIQLLNRYYIRHHKAIQFAVGRFTQGASTVKGVTIAPVFSPVARAFYTQDNQQLIRFVEVVVTGMAESRADSPAVVLRNFLIGGRDKGLSARAYGDRYLIYKKTEVALRAFLMGEEIQRLGQMTTEVELFPIPGEGNLKR